MLSLRGEVDASNAEDFDRALGGWAASGAVIVDLSAAAYLDSGGFEVLDRHLATGALMTVVSTTSVLRKAASLMSVPFHDTVAQARVSAS